MRPGVEVPGPRSDQALVSRASRARPGRAKARTENSRASLSGLVVMRDGRRGSSSITDRYLTREALDLALDLSCLTFPVRPIARVLIRSVRSRCGIAEHAHARCVHQDNAGLPEIFWQKSVKDQW